MTTNDVKAIRNLNDQLPPQCNGLQNLSGQPTVDYWEALTSSPVFVTRGHTWVRQNIRRQPSTSIALLLGLR